MVTELEREGRRGRGGSRQRDCVRKDLEVFGVREKDEFDRGKWREDEG